MKNNHPRFALWAYLAIYLLSLGAGGFSVLYFSSGIQGKSTFLTAMFIAFLAILEFLSHTIYNPTIISLFFALFLVGKYLSKGASKPVKEIGQGPN